jgi:glutamate 5-kinase
VKPTDLSEASRPDGPSPSHRPATRRTLPPVRRLVVKVGSAVVAPHGRLDSSAVQQLAADIAAVTAPGRGPGVQTVVVSSGAVACGFRAMGLNAPPRTIALKQAAAAVGQPILMRTWIEALSSHALRAAQVLYTADDLAHRTRFFTARRTMHELLQAGVVPIVNENDTVSFDEIRLGDNDRLSALTAALVSADLLLILSSVQGLYEEGRAGRVIPTVDDVAAAVRHVRAERSSTGVGGMATKVEAAGVAASWGVPTIVAGGREPGVVARVMAGEPVGTLFVPRPRRVASTRRWLSASARPRGTITIDDGALQAITSRGASLLPSGIVRVTGSFDRGAPVDIADRRGNLVARGLTNFSAQELEAIRGLRSSQIESRLGYRYADEAVHRDQMSIIALPREP